MRKNNTFGKIMNKGSKICGLILLMVLLVIVFAFSPNQVVTQTRIPHDVIRIRGNWGPLGFHAIASEEGWPGTGTWYDPYIIANYEILGATGDPAPADGVSACIHINDTTCHFIIENCLLTSEAVWGWPAIFLENVDNAQIFNNIIYHSFYGIHILGTDGWRPFGNRMHGNKITYWPGLGGVGIYLTNCEYTQVTANVIEDFSSSYPDRGMGIKIEGRWGYDSYKTSVHGNNITGNNFGIFLASNEYSSNAEWTDVQWNTLTNNLLESTHDDGVNNLFKYNYYSDYGGADSDGDGIGDTSYPIPGSTGSFDSHPLVPFTVSDSLIATEHQMTASVAQEKNIALGNDGISDIVVYSSKERLADNQFGPGDIWYQRVDENGAAIGSAVQVTSGDRDEWYCDISGDYIIYISKHETDPYADHIWLYQISTGEKQILVYSTPVLQVKIHNNHVVWRELDFTDPPTHIMFYDLAWLGTSEVPIDLSGPIGWDWDLGITDRFVTWVETSDPFLPNYIGGQTEVVAYDLIDNVRIEVTSTTDKSEFYSGISGSWIAWVATYDLVGGIPVSRYFIEAQNLETGETRVITSPDPGWMAAINIDGDFITWMSSEYNMYLHRMSTGETFQVTNEQHDLTGYSAISGNLVAYVDQGTDSEDIYVSRLDFLSDPIFIDDDGDFEALGFPGRGTSSDPYRIEYYSITDPSADLIHIQDTTSHFTIHKCTLDGMHSWGGQMEWYSGIYLSNVQYGTVSSNTIEGCWIGIRSLDSSSNMISGNNLTNNDRMGVYLLRSSGDNILENIAKNNGDSFFLEYCLGNTISRNMATDNSGYGFSLVNSHMITITNNTARGNRRGFLLAGSPDNLLSGNVAQDCDKGFFLFYSPGNNLSINQIAGCTVGIDVNNSFDCTIDGYEGGYKIIGTGTGTGIHIVSCNNVNVSNYVINGFDVGINIEYGEAFDLSVNYVTNNVNGIRLKSVSETMIKNSIISNNMIGVKLEESTSDNNISLNLFILNDDPSMDNGEFNQWFDSNLQLGNFWSNYWGEDDGSNGRVAGDGVGDTHLPHEGVDNYPLLDPTIPNMFGDLPVGDDWWLTGWLIWRGSWSPVDIQVTDPLGNKISRELNQIGLNAWYVEDNLWEPDSTKVMVIIATPPLSPQSEQVYSFQMTALEDLTYSMESFVSLAGEKLFERSVEYVPLAAGQIRMIQTKLEMTTEGELTVSAVPQYICSEILQPINPDGSSVFKCGRTIPVKFQLFDDYGQPVSSAHAIIEIAKISDEIIGDFEEADSTSAASEGNTFRYDDQAIQYIFNLGTKELEPGTYIIRIILDDGQILTVQISLR